MDCKQNELTFVRKMEELVKDQKTEFELAIINRGKYQLRSAYHLLEVSEDVWFQMDKKAKQVHVAKFNRTALKKIVKKTENVASPHSAELSIAVNVVLHCATLCLSGHLGKSNTSALS